MTSITRYDSAPKRAQGSTHFGELIIPYDYVVDSEGKYYIVRAETLVAGRPHLVAKLLYAPALDGLLEKCRGRLTTCTPHVPSPYGGNTEFLLDHGSITRHVTYRDVPISLVPNVPTEVQVVSRFLQSLGGTVYLTGSRLLGIARSNSDWDLAIVGVDPSRLCLELRRLCPLLRLFTPEECYERAVYYAQHSSSIDTQQLVSLFRVALPYLRSSAMEIGVFFTDGVLHHLPSVACLSEEPEGVIEGEILPSAGMSYLFPRTCLIKRLSGDVVALSTLAWTLAGLEALCGSRVRATNVCRTAEGAYWFKDSQSRLQFCPAI